MELMIIVVVLGVLTAIAQPSCRQYVAKAKRIEAKAALIQIATVQLQLADRVHGIALADTTATNYTDNGSATVGAGGQRH